MAKQGTTLQNYNNELVKCTFLCTIVAGECGLCSCCAAGVALHSNRMPVQCYGRRV